MKHETIEKNVGLMAILIVIVIAVGGLVEIIPLMFQAQTVQAAPGVKPYPPLQLAGRDIFIREGCVGCHSQMVRTLASEVQRYGPYSVAGESVYDRPFLWGSKRTGPDLARVGGRYSDDWHRVHLINPRNVVPESNMPGYPWLTESLVDPAVVEKKMRTLAWMGHPYTEADFASVKDAVVGKTELDAVIAFLQGRVAPAAEPAKEDKSP
ncbi:cytochrome-c oxidase, cbb3-type subunit II [Dokdonella immobilis]|uniref:Cytochrome c oxidase cbb3-type subunit 2 n=1 Tax=Dokdonella immobilis TaxID=578942 RepID=A0A1I5AHZ6_9GAMM|nr:cytochrome-c oxidase, cbb3-type subunit II [Dokdonella immobilis]SFN61849.1 cytochrome c oxidase cbb3-type subunit 2 [Dokdonella immobilis]